MTENSYINWSLYSDAALSQLIGNFVKQHRLQQNRSQSEVANDAMISRSTLSLLENGEAVNLNSLIKVLRVLDLLYIMDVFQVEETVSPVEYARLQMKKRKRAGRSKDTGRVEEEDEGW
ncbi:MAG: transcriptional regulator [Marinilabiliales bacterium]|nr:MAG: transcriptional regulator [Marinilabiliales bacterium]